ncbi:MAG TPA: hypothetical protein VFA98_10465, partial [Thermoanaerobaculia bacterium]|nr:hypothetical protein [Thermoanaerobaculia bacterium]
MVHSHLRWSFVWQRPQQIHSRLARRHPILFVEEPARDEASARDRLDVTSPRPNLWVAQPRLAPGPDPEGRTRRILAEAARGPLRPHFSGALHWVYTPMMEGQVDLFAEPGAVVYDCMDELSKFAQAPPRLLENEARLLARADVVFAGGYELGAAKARRHPNVHVFGCGVDFEHFRRASEMPEADDLAMIPRPRLGYYGVI